MRGKRPEGRHPRFGSGKRWKPLAVSTFYLILLLIFTVASIRSCEGGTNDAEARIEGSDDHSSSGEKLIVHFMDVGQGDAILIQTSTQNILIDGGERNTGVLDYLKNQGVDDLDIVIGNHPHSDHIGGLIDVLRDLTVKEIIDPGVVHTTKTYEEYLTLIEEKGVDFVLGRAGMMKDLGGGVTMEILHPVSPEESNLNDVSVVSRIVFGQVSFLFTGDIEKTGEAQILDQGCELASVVLKVGHHGSDTSTTEAFLKKVNPDTAVIMVGAGNVYGHPHEETLEKLRRQGVNIYRTDIHGNIVMTTDGQELDIGLER